MEQEIHYNTAAPPKRYRGQHGPSKYFTEEERIKGTRKRRAKFTNTKEWRCDICGDHNYTLGGTFAHLNTEKHRTNAGLMLVPIPR